VYQLTAVSVTRGISFTGSGLRAHTRHSSTACLVRHRHEQCLPWRPIPQAELNSRAWVPTGSPSLPQGVHVWRARGPRAKGEASARCVPLPASMHQPPSCVNLPHHLPVSNNSSSSSSAASSAAAWGGSATGAGGGGCGHHHTATHAHRATGTCLCARTEAEPGQPARREAT